jgi:hypothetical protein
MRSMACTACDGSCESSWEYDWLSGWLPQYGGPYCEAPQYGGCAWEGSWESSTWEG